MRFLLLFQMVPFLMDQTYIKFALAITAIFCGKSRNIFLGKSKTEGHRNKINRSRVWLMPRTTRRISLRTTCRRSRTRKGCCKMRSTGCRARWTTSRHKFVTSPWMPSTQKPFNRGYVLLRVNSMTLSISIYLLWQLASRWMFFNVPLIGTDKAVWNSISNYI